MLRGFQLERVCQALCDNIRGGGLGLMFGRDGPTLPCLRLLEEHGSTLSSSERVLFFAAWSFWNPVRTDRPTLGAVFRLLDGRQTRLVAELLIAFADERDNGAAVEEWLRRHDRSFQQTKGGSTR